MLRRGRPTKRRNETVLWTAIEDRSLKAETLPLLESCRAAAHRYEEVSGPLEEQAQQRAEPSRPAPIVDLFGLPKIVRAPIKNVI